MGLFAGEGQASALAHPPFRRFFAASLVSMPGNWMQITAQAWLVLTVHDSPMALAWMTTLQFLPILLFTLMGGALADRLSRRPLMIATQLVGAAQTLALALLVATGSFELWHLYGLAVILGFVNAIDGPLRQAMIADLVPREALAHGMSLGALSQNVGRVIGPGLAGLVIAGLGVPAAFAINCVTYLVCAALLASLRMPEIPARPATRVGLVRATRDGLSYAMGAHPVRFVLVATAFIGIFGQNFTTMIPLVATYLLDATPAEFGLLNSALGGGSLCAILVLARSGAPTVRRILLSGLGFGVLLLIIAQSGTMWLSCALFAVVGASAVIFSTSVQTALQLVAPPELRGRVAAMVTFLIVGTSPIGALLTGGIAQTLSVSAAIAVNGVLCILGITIALWIGAKRPVIFEPERVSAE